MLHTLLFCTVCSPLLRQGLFFCFVFLRNVWLLPAHKLDLFVKSGAKTSLPSRTYSICASCDIGLLLYPAVYICGLHGRPELVGALKKCRVNGYDNIRWSRGACVLWRKKKMFSGNTLVNLLLYVMLIANNSLGLKLFGNSLFHAVFSTLFLQAVSLPFFCAVFYDGRSLCQEFWSHVGCHLMRPPKTPWESVLTFINRLSNQRT